MNFDINQLFKGSVRNLVLDQLIKSVGLPEGKANGLLDRIVSVVIGGISKKSNSKEGVDQLLEMIKGVDSNTQQLYSTGASNAELGFDSIKQKGLTYLNGLFGSDLDGVVDQVSREEGVTQIQAKDSLSATIPAIFSSLKNNLGSNFSLSNLGSLAGVAGMAGVASAAGSQVLNKVTGSEIKEAPKSSQVTPNPTPKPAPSEETVNAARMAGVHQPQYTKTTESRPVEEPKKSGIWKWLIILALILIALLLFRSCGKDEEAPITQNEPTNTESTPVTNEQTTDSEPKVVEGLGNFSWDFEDKKLILDGALDSAESKANLLDAFKGIAGTVPVEDDLDIDKKAGKLEFTDFAALATALKGFVGVDGKFDGRELKLSGTLNSEESKTELLTKLKKALGDNFEIKADDIDIKADELNEDKDNKESDEPVEAKISKDLGDINWAVDSEKVVVSGEVPNEETKAKVLDAFKVIAGNRPLEDKLEVDADVGQFQFDGFAALADILKNYPTIDGEFDEGELVLDGTLNSEESKTKLTSELQSVLNDAFKVKVDDIDIDAPEAVDGFGDLEWAYDGEYLKVDGTASASDKVKILKAFNSIKGTATLKDEVDVENNISNMNLDSLDAFIKVVEDFPNVKGHFDGFQLDLDGHVISEERKAELVSKLQEALGANFKIDADSVEIDAPDVVKSEQPVSDTFPAPTAPAEDKFPAPTEEKPATPEAPVAPVTEAPAATEPTPASNATSSDIPEEPVEVLDINEMSKDKLDLNIKFKTASSEIMPVYNNRLDAFAKFLIDNNRTGEVAGFTDSKGDDESNKKLSAERAKAVRDYLIAKGVPEANIVAVGYGEANPIADNNTPEGRRANRRIEFNVKDINENKDGIGEMIKKTNEEAKEKVNDAVEASKETFKEAKEDVSRASVVAGEKIKNAATSVGEAVDNAAHKTEDVIQDIKEQMGGQPSETAPAPEPAPAQ